MIASCVCSASRTSYHEGIVDDRSENALDLDALVGVMPFAVMIGVKLEAAGPAEVIGRLPWAPARCTGGRVMHGGALMALADSVAGLCAYLNLPAGAGTSTISASTNFLRAVRSGDAVAVARPLHVGRSTIVVQTEIRDDDERLVAQVTQAQAILLAATG
jgi:1,4-dihydroxy-2-naphthoyl-CoA hydrolase